jgi:hypothetical protein
MPDPVRVLITGSRDWDLGEFADRVVTGLLAKHGPGLVIVHGACPTGVDASIDEAAREIGVEVEPHPADWDRLGKRAGPVRNQEMVDLGAAKCLAFHPYLNLKSNSGTADCVRRALGAGIPTWYIEGTSPIDHTRRIYLPGPHQG